MKKDILLLLFIMLNTCLSCSTEDSFIVEDEIIIIDGDKSHYIAHNKWTYEMMSKHYFWNMDIADSLSLDFSISPKSFFDNLLSKEDRFSWCEINENYNGEDLGFHYQTYELHGSLMNRVLYVYSKDLRDSGLKRGDYVVICKDSIEVGHIHSGRFMPAKKIAKSNSSRNTRGVNLAPTISLDTIYTIDNKKIGYFVYDQFESSTDVAQITIRLKNLGIDELILDLRYNPGGYVSTSQYLASMLAPKESLGKLYQLQRYNDFQTKVKKDNGGSGVDSVFLDKGFITIDRNLDLKRLVVLTTKNSASASESLIIGLRPYMDVVTIGTTSCGKDVGSYTIADNRYKYQLQPITFRYYNALNDSTPTTGIIPYIEVADDLNHERGDVNEALLKTAINYLIGNNIAVSDIRAVQSSFNEKEYGRSSIEMRYNL